MDTTPFSSVSTPGDETPTDAILFNPSRKRAMASFDNLVALANYQERLKDARKMVWRDRGEPVAELHGLRECFEHAATGGLRAATLAASIRACVNLVLVLLRIGKVPRDLRFAVVRRAVFGLDTWRSGAMLGSFTAIYKFLLNAMPILFPSLYPSTSSRLEVEKEESRNTSTFAEDDLEDGPTSEYPRNSLRVPLPRRNARLSLSTNAQMILSRKRVRKWHAALAGAIAGAIGIMFEKRSRRGVIAQQLFVRGLQGSYNSYTTKRNIRVPNGDVLVFAFACGQIMYGFLLRPDTLPRSYTTWIGQAAKVPQECVRMNCDLVREGTCNIVEIDKLLARADITTSNMKDLMSLRTSLLSPSTLPQQLYNPRYAPCSAVHPALSDCASVPLDRFFAVAKWMFPIYAALHFVPPILFKRKVFTQDPGKVIVKAGLGSLRSSTFLGLFVVIYQTIFCYKHQLHRYLSMLKFVSTKNPLAMIPQSVIDLLASKVSFWLTGFAAGLSLFVEAKHRRGELAMYVLPKGLESAWVMARGKGLVFRTGNLGGMWLSALGLGMVMSTYQNDPQHLSGLVRRILYQFIGPN